MLHSTHQLVCVVVDNLNRKTSEENFIVLSLNGNWLNSFDHIWKHSILSILQSQVLTKTLIINRRPFQNLHRMRVKHNACSKNGREHSTTVNDEGPCVGRSTRSRVTNSWPCSSDSLPSVPIVRSSSGASASKVTNAKVSQHILSTIISAFSMKS